MNATTHFILRRLHSLSGILPIGVFLISHLVTNSSILWGRFNSRASEISGGDPTGTAVVTFQEEVSWINHMPFLLLIEITLWGSIAFHAILGVYYATTGKSNLQHYSYQDNWRYTLQRVSGYVALVFIFYHVATLRWGWSFLVPGGTSWSHEFAGSTAAAAIQGSPDGFTPAGLIVALGYFIGITACVFHFANGVWTAAISWGLTVTAQAQRRWGYVCTALGVALMAAAWGSLFGFATLDPHNAAFYERDFHVHQGRTPSPDPFGGEGAVHENEHSAATKESELDG